MTRCETDLLMRPSLGKIFTIPLLTFIFILISACEIPFIWETSSDAELAQAQKELDQRDYAQVISRLDELAIKEPSIRQSSLYLDLLSSAYLGQAGGDLIEIFSFWAESLEKNNRGINALIPTSMTKDGSHFIHLTTTLLNPKLSQPTLHHRLLLKIMVSNSWEALLEVQKNLIPAFEKISATQDRNIQCDGLHSAIQSSIQISQSLTNVSLAITLFKESDSKPVRTIEGIAQFLQAFNWIQALKSCDELNSEILEKIKAQLPHVNGT